MKPYYVALTGSKNNAGDFLIKHRASQLFADIRPDRAVVDMDAWIPLHGHALETVNGAAALLLMGGPALQERMYPGVYPLTPSLDDIRVPIIVMGLGWKSPRGDWRDTYSYPLSDQTLRLLDKVRESGHVSSVRDFHTLNVLRSRGYADYLMTGCPAYYDLTELGRAPGAAARISKVAFSLGVSFVHSSAMEVQMKKQILALRDCYRDGTFEVVFHHSLDPAVFLGVYSASEKHYRRHLAFARWLDENSISYVDISGGADNLIRYYQDIDLHVGYRVHAHIFMNSRSRLSVLIAEDGRGRATADVMGGMLVEGYSRFRTGRLIRALSKQLAIADAYTPNHFSTSEVLRHIDYELASDGHRRKVTRSMIDSNFRVMRKFMEQLP